MAVFRDIRNVQSASTPRFSLVTASTPLNMRSSDSQQSSAPLSITDDFKIQPSVGNEMADKSPRNPLDWFGILVPPVLSNAQAFFKSALNEAVSNLTNISVEMRELEAEVKGLRHRIRSTE